MMCHNEVLGVLLGSTYVDGVKVDEESWLCLCREVLLLLLL